MAQRLLLAGADVVLPQSVEQDCPLIIEGEQIVGVGSAKDEKGRVRKLRFEGRIILPGLVDLHSDAIEGLVAPRPKIFFPLPFAIQECDERHIAAGITTVFNAISFAGNEFGVRDPLLADELARSLCATTGVVNRRLHIRYEITDSQSVPLIERLIEEDKVDLISFMNHSPDQGQYMKRGSYMGYLMRTYAVTEREARNLISLKRKNFEEHARDNVLRLIRVARAANIPMAAHDPNSPEELSQWLELGATISEFPLNVASARASRDHDMTIVMGAPNVIRGTSSYDALRARDAIEENLVDALCSDYKPKCLLSAIFQISSELGIPLPEAVSLATWKPAKATGVQSTGKIKEGYRADLIVVQPTADGPVLEAAMVAGEWRFLTRQF